MDNCNTKLMFIGFSLVVLFFMHLNMQRLSGIDSSCLVGHERTLSQLESFQDSLLESDLLVSFVDKSDLSRLERDKREAERRVEKLIRQLKIVQSELVCAIKLFRMVCTVMFFLDKTETEDDELQQRKGKWC